MRIAFAIASTGNVSPFRVLFLSLQEIRGEDNTDAASAPPAPEDVRAHMCLVQPSFSFEDV